MSATEQTVYRLSHHAVPGVSLRDFCCGSPDHFRPVADQRCADVLFWYAAMVPDLGISNSIDPGSIRAKPPQLQLQFTLHTGPYGCRYPQSPSTVVWGGPLLTMEATHLGQRIIYRGFVGFEPLSKGYNERRNIEQSHALASESSSRLFCHFNLEGFHTPVSLKVKFKLQHKVIVHLMENALLSAVTAHRGCDNEKLIG